MTMFWMPVLFNIVPKAVQELDLTDLEKYFALARGYQGEKGDVRARPMKKWFNTNYHYIVPAIEKTQKSNWLVKRFSTNSKKQRTWVSQLVQF